MKIQSYAYILFYTKSSSYLQEAEREREIEFSRNDFLKRKNVNSISKKFLLWREKRVEIFITFGITYIVLQSHRLQNNNIDRERERETAKKTRVEIFVKTSDGSGLTLSCFDFLMLMTCTIG